MMKGKLIIILILVYNTLLYSQSDLSVLDNLLEKYEVKYKEIVLSQAVLETGWFKCKKCSRELNNPFGFFWKGKYKKFRDLEHSVIYYKIWQDKWYKGGDYYVFLKNIGYAEDLEYISKLKTIIKQL